MLKNNRSNLAVDKAPSRMPSWGVPCWILTVSGFIVANYGTTIRPAFLLKFPLKVWNLVHALGGMVFAGSILTTTILEWLVVANGEESVQKFWFQHVPRVERTVVLPALTVSIVSGVAQSFISYASVRRAPRHVKSALHILSLFAIWWGATDLTTQNRALATTDSVGGDVQKSVMSLRRFSNVGSCLFLVALYAVMVLKPGFRPNVK